MALGEGPRDWSDWVSASETYHYCDKNPLIDYLNLYGESAGFVADSHRPGYDKRFDYVSFMVKQSWAFRREVIRLLSAQGPVRKIAGNPSQAHDVAKVQDTLAAIKEGVPIIVQGVLWNEESRMTGVPDLLVRSDVLEQVLGGHHHALPQRGRDMTHYVVVDIKFASFDLFKDGTASRKHLPHMVQNQIYNEALGKMQGYTPDASYLLGRDLFRAPARVNHADPELGRLAAKAAAWVRRLRKEGASWQVLPVASVPELRPNLKSSKDLEWHAATHEIAMAQHDLTLLPFVGPERRSLADAAGITGWDDPALSARAIGMGDSAEGRRLDAVLMANRSTGNEAVFPARLSSNVRNWRQPAPLEIFVSVQMVDDQADDFSRVPERGGTAMFFMITWGFLDRAGKWQTGQLVARDLSAAAEAEMIAAWQSELNRLADTYGIGPRDIRLFHWGSQERLLPEMSWFSLLHDLIHVQPVTVRGAFGFGLVEMAKAFHALGLIESALPDRPRDPLAAMAGAWSAAREATSRMPLEKTAPIEMIGEFSQQACRSMMEILAMLRQRATNSLAKAA